ncbi:N-acetyltransferase [Phenylobacterium sp. LjRoot219]|uniref:GNAT family N-acetyltransferase n=1 Tax=Phenylobacterium sp. LjRoot219 TaxID=3342283 RepID=UPI003ECF0EA4
MDLADPFFDSLKAAYAEFPAWFAKKADEPVYVSEGAAGVLQGFLYLKKETGAVTDVDPPLPPADRLKVGTLKIVAHGSKLGERFIKKIFDNAVEQGVQEIYVTVFEEHAGLIRLLKRYGFNQHSTKTTPNGTELVFVRSLVALTGDIRRDYPLIHTRGRKKHLLAIYPVFHTRLFPDSILDNENPSIVQDLSQTNSIHKVYITFTQVGKLKPGDIVVIYRCTDHKAPAKYRSVVTSVCVVEEVRPRKDFSSFGDFLKYAKPHSVFTREELEEDWWNSDKPFNVIRMTYNAAFGKRTTRGKLLDELGKSPRAYINFYPLTDTEFDKVIEMGRVNESLVVD